MRLPEMMGLLLGLTFLAVLLEVSSQQSATSDFIVSSCRGSQIQHDLPSQYVLAKFLRFSAIDQNGNTIMITDSLATQCGYKISQDGWGNMTFTISLYSCYVHIQNDTYFTVPVLIEISSSPDMVGAASYLKITSCPYYWSPREILCETNYMEVSVRRKIPVISEGIFRDEPEDWASAFDAAVTGLMSIWQIVFHKSSAQKTTMLIDAALNAGYGVNTTESRTLLRSSYNATEAIAQKVGGVTFSTVRATMFYKQRWFIYLIDNAVACPVDDVAFSTDFITWTIPKNIFPLLIGAKTVQKSTYQFGLDLINKTEEEIRAYGYQITDGATAITVRMPIGGYGGYYKSNVVNLVYGVNYNIKPFLENVWTDDAWGVTKYTVIKDITTPFETMPHVIKNDTIPSTEIFNVSVGSFFIDVVLINVTLGGGATQTVEQAKTSGYEISVKQHLNGSLYFVVKVPFIDQHVTKTILPDGMLFTLNLTLGFIIIPFNETFTISTTVQCFIPHPIVGPCLKKDLNYAVPIANLDGSLKVYIANTLAPISNSQVAGPNLNLSVQIPVQSDLVMHEATSTGVSVVVPINIKNSNGATVYSYVVNCEASKSSVVVTPVGDLELVLQDYCFQHPIMKVLIHPGHVCLPEGVMQIVVMKMSNIPNMDMSMLRLRDGNCGPDSFDANRATFSIHANECQTMRMFMDNFMLYYNEITYASPSGKLIFIENVTCTYTTNGTVQVPYAYQVNPTPSAVSLMASLELVLRLSKDISYMNFYGDADYPVVKYLREPLYFEVELLYSSDPQLELFLDTCWATKSPDMNSSPSWPIVVNSCEYGEPYQTIFHSVTADSRVQFPSHFKRFEVKTFSFMDGDNPYTGTIYFHCDVIICDASNLASDPVCTGIGSCIPAKQRLGRSIDANRNFHSTSSKAVFLLAPRVESYAVQS